MCFIIANCFSVLFMEQWGSKGRHMKSILQLSTVPLRNVEKKYSVRLDLFSTRTLSKEKLSHNQIVLCFGKI